MENSGMAWFIFFILFMIVGIFNPFVFGLMIPIACLSLVWFIIYKLIGGS
jgi:hypothetical protein